MFFSPFMIPILFLQLSGSLHKYVRFLDLLAMCVDSPFRAWCLYVPQKKTLLLSALFAFSALSVPQRVYNSLDCYITLTFTFLICVECVDPSLRAHYPHKAQKKTLLPEQCGNEKGPRAGRGSRTKLAASDDTMAHARPETQPGQPRTPAWLVLLPAKQEQICIKKNSIIAYSVKEPHQLFSLEAPEMKATLLSEPCH